MRSLDILPTYMWSYARFCAPKINHDPLLQLAEVMYDVVAALHLSELKGLRRDVVENQEGPSYRNRMARNRRVGLSGSIILARIEFLSDASGEKWCKSANLVVFESSTTGFRHLFLQLAWNGIATVHAENGVFTTGTIHDV